VSAIFKNFIRFFKCKNYKRRQEKNYFLHSFIHVFFIAQEPLVGQGLLFIEASRSHSIWHSTFGRTPLVEWSARCRGFYLTRQNTDKRKIFMPLAGFETTIPASERPQTRTIDGTTTETGCLFLSTPNLHKSLEFISYFFFQNYASVTRVT